MKKVLKSILKMLPILAVIVGVAFATYFILRACGFTTLEDFTRLKEQMGDSISFWLIIVALQVVQAVFIQVSNSLITAPVSILFYDELWKVFLSSWIGVFIGNMILYLIGRFAGSKLLKFVLGDEEKANKMTEFMKSGKWFYLIGCVCPILPSDILNTLSGTAKYNFWFVLVATFITRGICVASTTWLVGLIPHHKWLIFVIVALMLFMVALAYIVTRKAIKKNESKSKTI